MTQTQLLAILEHPGTQYRSVPFWSWNGKLDQARLDEQLEQFAAAGMGGFFMHAREGLETEYLSEEWMTAVAASAEKGKKLGLLPYLYDEEKWPSGMAGGRVAKEHPEFRASAVTLAVGGAHCRYTFCAVLRDRAIASLRMDAHANPGETLLGFDVEFSGASDWYSGSAPSDNLNPASVNAFLSLTHERYRQKFGGDPAGSVAGFFTDEPNFCDFFASFTPGRPWLPWTAQLPAYFRQHRGYALTPYLPYLFYPGEMAPQIRHDYWQTLTELFDEAYFQQLYRWCESSRVKLCGHLLFENSLGYQARVCGAAMPHYRWFHIPGIDLLGEQTEEYLTVKQCTSVAHQFSRPAISETYGCTGWQFSFEGQKWVWDWQAVMGISLRCQHLAQYTIKGLRKRDYPPSFGPQSEWWKYERPMEEYCARLAAVVQNGEVCRDILVIHPQSSVWTLCGSDPEEDLSHFDGNMGWTDAHICGLNERFDGLRRFARAMLLNQCDFDFGDEMILAKEGRAENGTLCVGKGRYRLVILPRVQSLFADTCRLLAAFEKTGGRVVWIGGLPSMIQGRKSALPGQLFPDAQTASEEAALEIARSYRRVRLTDLETLQTAPVLTSLRELDDGCSLLVVNNDRKQGRFCAVRLPQRGAVTEYNLLTGEKTPVAADSDMRFYVQLRPADSRVYLLDTTKAPRAASLRMPYRDVHQAVPVLQSLGPCARFRRTMPNALTLDQCRYRTGGGWSPEMDVWQAQRQVRAAAGFRPIYGNGQAMRNTWLNEKKPGIQLQLSVSFQVRDMPQNGLLLALEEADRLHVCCNGTPCARSEGFFLDREIGLVSLADVREGRNELLLSCTYTQDMELEDMYLLGDFAADAEGVLVREPQLLRFGDWCLQGYPHYPGSMVYLFSFEARQTRLKLHLGGWAGTLLTIAVNGGAEQVLLWHGDNDRVISVQPGQNTLEVTVVGSNRNLLGPLHQPCRRNSRIDWTDFRTEGAAYSAQPVLQPYGLLQQIDLEPC